LGVSFFKALGLALLLAFAACASANVSGGGDDDGGTGGDASGDGKSQADAHLDGQKDGSLQDDAGDGDGGTCTADQDEGFGNNDCASAVNKGSLTDATSSHLSIVANLWPAGDVDWYKVSFVDSPETAGVCDKLNIRIGFAQNPGDRYLFDVVADDCTDAPSCGQGEQAAGITDFTYTDDFACPCVEQATPPATTDGTHICVDHSMTLRIRIYRVVGAPAICENYELSIDNG
jgi:hypothetical protein